MRLTNFVMAVGLTALGACSSTGPRIHTANTAYERYASLSGPGQKALAAEFYNRGRADATMAGYWIRQQGIVTSRPQTGDASKKDDGLQRGYVNVPVPGYQDATGVVREPHLEAIEVVH